MVLEGVLRGRLMACMDCPCYAVGRLYKHVGDVDGSSEAKAGGRRGRLQKHASNVCEAAEAKAGGRRWRPVGLVGVLRGRFTACMARPCYAAGRQQKHASDVCGETEAKVGGRQGRPCGLSRHAAWALDGIHGSSVLRRWELAKTFRRCRPWHDITALGQHTRSTMSGVA